MNTALTGTGHAQQPSSLLRLLRDSLSNMLGAVSVLLGLPAEGLLRPSLVQVILWQLLNLASLVLLQYQWQGEDSIFVASAIGPWLVPVAISLGLGAAIALRTGISRFAAWLVLALAASEIALHWVLYLVWPSRELFGFSGEEGGNQLVLTLQIWQGATLTLASARMLLGSGPWRWPVAAALLTLVVWQHAEYTPSFWRWDDSQAPTRPPASAPADEQTMYRQPQLLQQQLNALQAQRPGVVDLYVLAIAGDAGEPVFQREVQHVQRLLDARFDSRGRSLLLINHEATRERIAIASQTSIAAALQHIGRLANAQEDIVLVYLTSHGSSSHEFVLDYPPLPLQGLRPQDLARMLRQAGIGYRAIIVSACYSGGFLPELKDRQALVMTAADADSTSFGCGADTHYTWFGQALFRHALSRTHSLEQGFARAQQQIVRWEKRDTLEPSNPLMDVGPAFRQQWARLEQRLAHPLSTRTSSACPADDTGTSPPTSTPGVSCSPTP